jgi:hypothetical protein
VKYEVAAKADSVHGMAWHGNVLQEFKVKGIEEMRFVRIPYSGR